MPYLASKTYGQGSGFSCCYRDHTDDDTTLGQLHGAVLSFKIMLEADALDAHNKVVDPEFYEKIEEFLENTFGHTTVVAQDDPAMEGFDQLDEDGAIDLVVLPAVSLETFARSVFNYCQNRLETTALSERVMVHSVECRESDGDSAIFARDDTVIEFTADPEQDNKGEVVPS